MEYIFEYIYILDNIHTIGQAVFKIYHNFSEVVLPSSLTLLQVSKFESCGVLKNMISPNIASISHVKFKENGLIHILFYLFH